MAAWPSGHHTGKAAPHHGSTPPKRPNMTIQQKVLNCSNATKGHQCFYTMIKKLISCQKGISVLCQYDSKSYITHPQEKVK